MQVWTNQKALPAMKAHLAKLQEEDRTWTMVQEKVVFNNIHMAKPKDQEKTIKIQMETMEKIRMNQTEMTRKDEALVHKGLLLQDKVALDVKKAPLELIGREAKHLALLMMMTMIMISPAEMEKDQMAPKKEALDLTGPEANPVWEKKTLLVLEDPKAEMEVETLKVTKVTLEARAS